MCVEMLSFPNCNEARNYEKEKRRQFKKQEAEGVLATSVEQVWPATVCGFNCEES